MKYVSAHLDRDLDLALALGRFRCMSVTPFLSRPSTAMHSSFCRRRFLNSIVAVDVWPLMSALVALHPMARRRLCRALSALDCENFGVHFTLSSFVSWILSVVSSMNMLCGLAVLACLCNFAGGLPCRGQRNHGSPHSHVHCLVGRGTWQPPHQRALAKALSWNIDELASLAYSHRGHWKCQKASCTTFPLSNSFSVCCLSKCRVPQWKSVGTHRNHLCHFGAGLNLARFKCSGNFPSL